MILFVLVMLLNKDSCLLIHCLKITQKVSFNIASEASYVYISSKMPKMVYFGEYLKQKACGQTVLPDRPILIEQKLVENAKIEKSQMRHFR